MRVTPKAVILAPPLVLALATPALAQVDFVRQQLTQFIEGLVSNENQKVKIEGLSGIPFDVKIERVTIADTQGVWLTVNDVSLDIAATALLRGRLEIDKVGAARTVVARAPVSPPTDPAADNPFTLPQPPELPQSISRVLVQDINFERIELQEPLLGEAAVFTLNGSVKPGASDDVIVADLKGRRIDENTANLSLNATLDLARQAAKVDLHAEETGALFADLTGIPEADRIYLDLNGDGPLKNWDASLVFDAQSLLHANADAKLDYSDTPKIDLSAVVAPVPGVFPADVGALLGRVFSLDVKVGQTSPDTFQLDRFDLESAFLKTDGRGRMDFKTGELDGNVDVVLPDLAKASALAKTDLAGEAKLTIDASGTVQEPLFVVDLSGSGIDAANFGVETVASKINVRPLAALNQPFAGVGLKGDGRVAGVTQNGEPLRPEDALQFGLDARVPTKGEAVLNALTLEGDTFKAEATADVALPDLKGKARINAAVPDLRALQAALGPLAPEGMNLEGAVTLRADADIAQNAERVDARVVLGADDFAGLPADADRVLGPDPRLSADLLYVKDERVALNDLDLKAETLNLRGTAGFDLPSLEGKARLDAGIPDLAALGQALRDRLPPDLRPKGSVDLKIDATTAADLASAKANIVLAAQGLSGLPGEATRLVGSAPKLKVDVDYVKDGRVALTNLDLRAAKLGLAGRATLGLDAKRALNGRVTLTLPELAALEGLLKRPIAGEGKAVVDLGGTLDRPDVKLDADATPLSVAGQDFERVALEATAAGPTDDLGGDMTLTARTRGEELRLASAYSYTPNLARLKGLRLTAPATELDGDLAYNLVRSFAEGRVEGQVGDFTALRPFTGQDVRGQGRVDLRLSADAGRQKVDLNLDAPKVAGDFGDVEGLKLDAAVNDALGTPSIDAKAHLDRFTQGDLRVDTARIDANGGLNALRVEAALKGAKGGEVPFDVETAAVVDARSAAKTVRVERLEGSVADEPLRLQGPLTVSLPRGGYALEGLDLTFAGARLAGDAKLAGETLAGDLRLENFDLVKLDPYLERPVRGRLEADVKLDGSPSAPDIALNLDGRQIKLDERAFAEVPPATIDLEGRYDQEQFTGNLTIAGTFDDPLRAEVRLPLDLSLQPFAFDLPQDRQIGGGVTGKMALARLVQITQLDGQQAKGVLDIDLSLDGTYARPLANGAVRVDNGAFSDANSGVRLDNIVLDVEARGRTVEIATLRAQGPGNGTVTGGGRIEMAPERNFPFDFTLNSNNARLLDNDLGVAVVTSDLSIDGDARAAKLAGTVNIDQADLQIPSGGVTDPPELDVVVRRNGELVPQPKPEAGAAAGPPFNLALDVKVNAPERIFVRGRGLSSEWGGNLTIDGQAAAPEIVGSIDFRRGFLDFLGERFTITEGSVGFTGDTPPTPQVKLVAEAERDGFTAIVRVTGPATEPEVKLTSEPELPQDQVLSRLLFDQDVSDITPAQGLKLAAAVRELQGGGPGLLDKFRGSLGLDTLDIGGEGDQSAVSAGKYIADDVYLEVEQGLATNTTRARVEVDLGRGFDATSEVGSDGNSGAGINWSLDY